MKKALPILLSAALTLGLTLSALAAPSGFADVPDDAPYAEAVAYVRERGVMNGTTETTFNPSGTVTRGQLAAILYRMSGNPAVENATFFNDVTPGMYYADASAWAAANGYVNGYEDGSFRGGNPVTRQQTTAILWRMAGSPESGAAAGFSDRDAVSGYAKTAVDWAYERGIVSASDGEAFAPNAPAERSRMAVMLMRYLQLTENVNGGAVKENVDGGAVEEVANSNNRRSLVIWFSAAHNTADADAVTAATVTPYGGTDYGAAELAAKFIRDYVGADGFAVSVEKAYPQEYEDLANAAKAQRDNDERPTLTGYPETLSEYDAVFMVYPIWWYGLPMPLYTLFEQCDFSGKTILPVALHAGSRFSGTIEDIAELEPEAVVVKDGFTVAASGIADAKTEVETWLDSVSAYWA